MCGVGYMTAVGLVQNPTLPAHFEYNRILERELVTNSVIALDSEDFRGGRNIAEPKAETRDGGGVTYAQQQGLDSIYWDSFQKRGDIDEILEYLGKPKMDDIKNDEDVPLLATGSLLLPRNKKLCDLTKRIWDETFEMGGYEYGEWRDMPLDNNVLGERARKTHPRFSNYIVPLRPGIPQDQAEREIEFLSQLAMGRIREAAKAEHEASVAQFEAGEIAERQIQPDLSKGKNDFRVVSMSSQFITFKSLVPGCEIAQLFKDILDERFLSPIALFHQRESTNTDPFWHLAHPFGGTFAYQENGETNTKKRNVQAAPSLFHHFQDQYFAAMQTELFDGKLAHLAGEIFPIIHDPEDSDTAINAQEFGFLTRLCGLSPESAVALMVPPNYKADPSVPSEMRDIYNGAKTIAPPHQGPKMAMALNGTASDENGKAGWQLTVFNDQDGLRPTFYEIVRGNEGKIRFAIGGSEKNMWQNFPGFTTDNLVHQAQLRPGERQAITSDGQILTNSDLMAKPMAELADIGELTREHMIRIEPQEDNDDFAFKDDPEAFMRRLLLANYDEEKLEGLKAQGGTGIPVLGSMGNDTQDPADSPHYHPLWDSMSQDFSEVSDPPKDSVREESTMENSIVLGRLFDQNNKALNKNLIWLDDFNVSNATLKKVRETIGEEDIVQIDCTFHMNSSDDNIQEEIINDAAHRAVTKAREGKTTIVLSDEEFGERRSAVDMAALVGRVNDKLEQEGLRHSVNIVVRSSEGWTDHHAMALKALGADVVNFYLAEDIQKYLAYNGAYGADVSPSQAVRNQLKAINKGSKKISAKKGVSDTTAYYKLMMTKRMAPCLREFAFKDVPATTEGAEANDNQEGGITLKSLTRKKVAHHKAALERDPTLPLPHRGSNKRREGLETEEHGIIEDHIAVLHEAVRTGDYDKYVEFEELVDAHDRATPTSTWDFIGLTQANDRTSIPFDDLKAELLGLPLKELYEHPVIRKLTGRTIISPMSYGSVSPEAKQTLHAGANMVGAECSSGEGGEPREWMQDAIVLNGYVGDRTADEIAADPNKYDYNSTIKQLGSGRFGVTPEYLRSAKSIEIKIAQGAKPGEGGQLMWIKVNHEIAGARGVEQWTTLISPPPHHDIYSIEDLTQIIYDLKQAAPDTGVKVKLVSKPGVGTIANGSFKDLLQANAGEYIEAVDSTGISGADGGTGAAQMNSINHAGGDGAAGLAEANQALTAAGFRNKAELHADGGIRTSNDDMKRYAMGSERNGMGTAALHGAGCIGNKSCHENTCPVGVATMDPRLRAEFPGQPEHLANYLVFKTIRTLEKLYELGYTEDELEDFIGRVEHLEPLNDLTTGNSYAEKINFDNILAPALGPNGERPQTYVCTTKVGDLNPLYSGEDTIDEQMWAKHEEDFRRIGEWYYNGQKGPKPEPVKITIPKGTNNYRALATRLNARLATIFHTKDRPIEIVKWDVNGSLGQSAATFIEDGSEVQAYGSCDYAGRGMAGGRIIFQQPPRSQDFDVPFVSSISGNTAAYGATGGKILANGLLGNRMGVRYTYGIFAALGAFSFPAEYQTGGTILLASPNVDTYYKDLIPDGIGVKMAMEGAPFDIFDVIRDEFNRNGTEVSDEMKQILAHGSLARGMSGGTLFVMDPLERMKYGLDPNLTYEPVADDTDEERHSYDILAELADRTRSKYVDRLLRHWNRASSVFNKGSMKVIRAIPNEPPPGVSNDNGGTPATLTVGQG